MEAINLEIAQRVCEELKRTRLGLRNSLVELAELKARMEKQEKEFFRALKPVFSQLEEEERGLGGLERALEEVLLSWKETEERILLEYRQERIAIPRLELQRLSVWSALLKETDIRLRF